jgi:hypothetical protein
MPEEVRASFIAANTRLHELRRQGFAPDRYRRSRAMLWLVYLARTQAPTGLPSASGIQGIRGVARLSSIGRSADGSRAAVYVTHGCGKLCGLGHLVTLRRDGSPWRVVEAKML